MRPNHSAVRSIGEPVPTVESLHQADANSPSLGGKGTSSLSLGSEAPTRTPWPLARPLPCLPSSSVHPAVDSPMQREHRPVACD